MAIDFKHFWQTWGRALRAGIFIGMVGITAYSLFDYTNSIYFSGLPIVSAIKRHDYPVIRRILDKGTPPDKLRVHGLPCIVWAVQLRDTQSVRLLLAYGSDPIRPLQSVHDTACTRLLLATLTISNHSIGEKQEAINRALNSATRNHDVSVCRLLLRAGADPNIMFETIDGTVETALMAWTDAPVPESAEAKQAAQETLDLLLAGGARLEMQNSEGKSALDLIKLSDKTVFTSILKDAVTRQHQRKPLSRNNVSTHSVSSGVSGGVSGSL